MRERPHSILTRTICSPMGQSRFSMTCVMECFSPSATFAGLQNFQLGQSRRPQALDSKVIMLPSIASFLGTAAWNDDPDLLLAEGAVVPCIPELHDLVQGTRIEVEAYVLQPAVPAFVVRPEVIESVPDVRVRIADQSYEYHLNTFI